MRSGDLKGPRPSSRHLRPEDLPPEILAQLGLEVEKPSKYHNRRVVVDGVKFDSQKEAERWGELRLLEAAGEILNLRRQVRYNLNVNQQPICVYVADFVYEQDGQTIVSDAKGYRTAVYQLKCKLMKACFGIIILEV